MKRAPDYIRNFLYSYSYSMGSIYIPIDADLLAFKERMKYSYGTQATCVIFAEQVKDIKAVKALRKKKIAQRHKLEKEHRVKPLQFTESWFKGFGNKNLQDLLIKYYVSGSKRICLAVTPENKHNLPLYKFLLPEYLILGLPTDFDRNQANKAITKYFVDFTYLIRGEFDNEIQTDKKEFEDFINNLREIAEHFEFNGKLNKDDYDELYCLFLPGGVDIIEDLMKNLHESLVNDLIDKNQIIKCKHCGMFAKYFRGKKYCNKEMDGRNCRSLYHSRQDYYRHKQKRLKVKRDWMRKTRQEIPGY